LNGWVDVGSGLAVIVIFLRCIGPSDWRHPRRWRLPDLTGTFLIFVGTNAIVEAVRIGRLLVLGRVAIHSSGSTFVSLDTEDAVLFLAGVIAGAAVGMIAVRDGFLRLVR
jgi:hypothetical protein